MVATYGSQFARLSDVLCINRMYKQGVLIPWMSSYFVKERTVFNPICVSVDDFFTPNMFTL